MAEQRQHFYGGQAVIEGVMMRGLEDAAIAVRGQDGSITLNKRNLGAFGQPKGWLSWPLIRGNVMLVETLMFGMSALQFSADVVATDELRTARETGAEPSPEALASTQKPTGIGKLAMFLTMAASMALAVGLFLLLPTYIAGLIPGLRSAGHGASTAFVINGHTLLNNVIEGGIRLAIMLLYIVAVSTMKYVRRVFEYHGAEHATINCYEAGEPVTVANCAKYSPLHPRCGTAFLLVVVLVKIVVGWFFGWPSAPVRMLIRVALLPLVAAIAYEVIRWAGRHRQSLFARALAWPGMMMQKLTTRQPGPEQLEAAIYALAALAPDVDFPADGPVPKVVDAQMKPQPLESANYFLAGRAQTEKGAPEGATP